MAVRCNALLAAQAHVMKYQLEPHHRDVPDEELLNDLKNVANSLGKDTVTFVQYRDGGRFHPATLSTRFGSWFAALEKAGLKITRHLNVTDDELFNNLVELWTAVGRQPKYRDLSSEASKYSHGPYERRFGQWRKALEAFVAWANEGLSPEVHNPSGTTTKKRTLRNINWRLRALVLMRDGARCQLCGVTPQDGSRLHVDHIKPWSKGGETVIDNLQILCEKCNIGKSDVEIDG